LAGPIWREPEELDPATAVDGAAIVPSFPSEGSQLTLLRFEPNASIPPHVTASIDYLIVFASPV
jgi:hypothetical protein